MPGGKRMAVLAGSNYPGWEKQLKGCINDVVSMKNLLISIFGFKEYFIELLTDDAPTVEHVPTGANIKRALGRMAERSEEGDLLFFHFSGHGTYLRGNNEQGAIIPPDWNLITDMDFRRLVGTIHHKATFTILADSCHSGGLINEQKVQIGPAGISPKPQTNSNCKAKYIPIEDIQNRFQRITGLNLTIDEFMRQFFGDNASVAFMPFAFKGFFFRKTFGIGILLSACQHDETAKDDWGSNPPHGKFTYAVMTVLLNKFGDKISNRQLVIETRNILGNIQHPCLYSNDENANATFLLQGQANTN